MLVSPDGKQGSLCCLPGGGALQLLPEVGRVVALQHAKGDLKHLLQTLLPAIGNTLSITATKVGQVAALQHAIQVLKHLLQTLLPAIGNTVLT